MRTSHWLGVVAIGGVLGFGQVGRAEVGGGVLGVGDPRGPNAKPGKTDSSPRVRAASTQRARWGQRSDPFRLRTGAKRRAPTRLTVAPVPADPSVARALQSVDTLIACLDKMLPIVRADRTPRTTLVKSQRAAAELVDALAGGWLLKATRYDDDGPDAPTLGQVLDQLAAGTMRAPQELDAARAWLAGGLLGGGVRAFVATPEAVPNGSPPPRSTEFSLFALGM